MNAQSVIKKYNAFNGKVVDYTMLDEFFHQVKDVVCVVDKSSMHYEHVKLIEKRVGKTLKIIGNLKEKVKLEVEPIKPNYKKPSVAIKLPSEIRGKKKVKRGVLPGVKASVSQAIDDLVKQKPEKYAKKAMAMQLLYSKFKDSETNELETQHFITKMLEKNGWIEFEKSGNVYDVYTISQQGKEVLNAIVGRLNSLQVKKQGGELFDNLNGYLYGLETENPDGESDGLGSTKEGQNKIYDLVTEKMLEAMRKSNGLPWRKPWLSTRNAASNYKTKKEYDGINFIMLNFVAPEYGRTGQYWLTYKQANELGGKIKKGAMAFPVLYYNLTYIVTKPERKQITQEQYNKLTSQEKDDKGAFPIATVAYYNVFNQTDIEGIEFKSGKEVFRTDAEKIESAEAIVEGMPNRPEIIFHKVGRAFYTPSKDTVTVPELKYFVSDQEYYSTLFHELVHSTGHSSRLDRFSKNKKEAEGKDDYAYEELIAELGASYLNAESGILYFTLKNSAVYLKGWQRKLEDIMKGDNRFFIKAAAKATQAAKYILNESAEEKKETKSSEENSYAVDAAVLAGVNFKEYKLTGRWKNEIGDKLYSDNQLMFWGMPGHGKTVLQLQLAQYIAEELKLPVLYIANEEFKRSTLAQKIKQFKIGHPNLKFAKSINEKEIGKYAVVFFDSINSLGMSLKEYLKFRERHADKLFVLVVQSTKDGNFRGGQEWEHEVDIAGEVMNRKLILRKHRLDPDNAKKAEKMATQQAIKEARKKKEIRQAISSKVNDKKLKPVQP